MSSTNKESNLFFNRELSWLKFNERVLEEALDTDHPLIERLKFLAIFSSNLDEFFMIRVAGLKEQEHAGIVDLPIDGLIAMEQISRISEETHRLVNLQSKILLEDILPKLRKRGIRLRHFSTLTTSQKEDLRDYYKEKIFPILTPLGIDLSHPFPSVRSLGINLLVELRAPYERKSLKRAVIPLPPSMNRFVRVPGKNEFDFVLVEEVIKANLDLLFPEMKILRVSEFRFTRNADLDLSEAEADDLLKLIERELRKRRLGTLIRMEINSKMNPEGRKFLQEVSGLGSEDIYEITGHLNLTDFFFFLSLPFPDLKDAQFSPGLNPEITQEETIFDAIKKQDILLHHPYESFRHVIELIEEAAKDPDVLAIKQTLYRTSGNSPIVQALKDAVVKGKQVTALIELKARFDEENNIGWARELENSGVNVIYGILGLKTHCKICMVIRQEEKTIRRYLHMGTGNYNAKTAKIYTDLGLLTCDEEMGKDASDLFNLLTGFSGQKTWRKFLLAPINLRERMVENIQNCIKSHTKETPSKITMVMNSLVDPEMIRNLYKASQKGITVELIIRGICCLKPGMTGMSENIRVRSIVGRFLEHTRIFSFEYEGNNTIYLGSADLMQRNLNRRVELVFPVERDQPKEKIRKILQVMLSDNVKARFLTTEGEYFRKKRKGSELRINSQESLIFEARKRLVEVDTTRH